MVKKGKKKKLIFVPRTFHSPIHNRYRSQIYCIHTVQRFLSLIIIEPRTPPYTRSRVSENKAREKIGWIKNQNRSLCARCLHRARFVSPGARDAENQYGIFSFRPVNSADMNFSADRIPAFVSRTARTSSNQRPTSSTHWLPPVK